jgi:hypothetical protein
MFALTRRIVGAFAALSLILGQAFVCAPVLATASEGHCGKSAAMAAAAHECCPSSPTSSMKCCAAPERELPGVPQQDSGRTEAGFARLHVLGTPGIVVNTNETGFALFRGAPPHGYRSTDLPILNSAFLL